MSNQPIQGSAVSRALDRAIEHLIAVARTDPAEVVADARARGLPIKGTTVEEQVASLRECDVSQLDKLAAGYITANANAAAVQGFVANLGGVLVLPVAAPADTIGTLAWIVRATSGVMTAYGFETETSQGRMQLRVGLLAAAGVTSLATEGGRIGVRQLATQILGGQRSDRLVGAVTRAIAKRFGLRLARGRFTKAVPLVGGAVGAGLNLALVRGTAGRARAHYRGLLLDWQRNSGVAADGGVIVLPPA